MADLVPTDGEKFEWVDDHPRAGDVPQAKEDDCIDNYLTGTRTVECRSRAKGKVTYDIEDGPLLEGYVRGELEHGTTHLVGCRDEGASLKLCCVGC